MNTKELGDLGERLSCEYLVKKGYRILEKNYRVTLGEIDIVAKKKGIFFFSHNKTIHFIEVKTIATNSSGFFPEQHVDYRKQRKLRQLAEIWLSKNKFTHATPYQIDIIGITVDHKTRNARLYFFPNAVAA